MFVKFSFRLNLADVKEKQLHIFHFFLTFSGDTVEAGYYKGIKTTEVNSAGARDCHECEQIITKPTLTKHLSL